MLIHLLVMKILPSIFEQRRYEAFEDKRWADRIRTIPGGQTLLATKEAASAPLPIVAYISMSNVTLQRVHCLSEGRLAPHSITQPGSYLNAFPPWLQLTSQIHSGIIYGYATPEWPPVHAAILRIEVVLSNAQVVPEGVSEPPISMAAAAIEDFIKEVPEVFSMDGRDEFEEVPSSEEFSDAESIATDAGDELDFSMLQSTSREAVDVQAFARFSYESKMATPKLGDLAAILPDAKVSLSPEDVEGLMTFRASLAALMRKLDCLLTGSSSVDMKLIPPQHELTSVEADKESKSPVASQSRSVLAPNPPPASQNSSLHLPRSLRNANNHIACIRVDSGLKSRRTCVIQAPN
ncbi:hypothetical protein M422DRAFT_269067 [Sphaerobolus stellatus SS14]|uniref:Uncharacterized protein n=1 Tax=Sphaerobolus stellatus (strain SS14) TaxID=990650 RepID=A0A0C9UL44_SPHS4|nr:hypothetical protein M422DRAFT_269067 [Sphaerobolus stellatus SS14]